MEKAVPAGEPDLWGTKPNVRGFGALGARSKEIPMYGENFSWLLPVWLIGAPFVLGLIEFFRLPKSTRM